MGSPFVAPGWGPPSINCYVIISIFTSIISITIIIIIMCIIIIIIIIITIIMIIIIIIIIIMEPEPLAVHVAREAPQRTWAGRGSTSV